MYRYEGLVRQVIDYFGKTPQYQILISQLVLICNAITKGDVVSYNKTYKFDNTWKIDGMSMKTVLENDYNFVDQESLNFPIITMYPTKPIEPVAPELINKPVKPTEVVKPIKPTEVLEPEKLETVAEPVKPTEVLEPIEPDKYIPDPIILALIKDYNENKLVKRDEYTSLVRLDIFTTFEKKFRNTSEVTVEFYDQYNNYINKYTTDMGSYITYEDIVPQQSGDKVYTTYKFSHWQYEDGTVLDLNNVIKNGFVYPVFVGDKIREYTIGWNVGKECIYQKYYYNDIPSYSETTEIGYSGNYYYEFIGWDKNI